MKWRSRSATTTSTGSDQSSTIRTTITAASARIPPANDDGSIETSELTIGLGFLAGLNEETPDGTLKHSVELDF